MQNTQNLCDGNVTVRRNCSTLIVVHNKALAAQFYGKFKDFFLENAVEYFVNEMVSMW